jgi:hypothetical protein
MSGKKQAFKDILRNCFPVVLDDLLDQPNQEKSDLDSIETKTGKKGEDYHTESPIDNDTVPLDATVSRGDTVSLYDTVSFQDTVTPDDPVFSPDTQLSLQTNTAIDADVHHTESPIDNDTVPLDATVSRGDTVSLYDTVSFQDTVTPDDPVFSPDTQLSSVKTNFYHSTDITNFFKMDADVYDVLAKFQTPFERVVYWYLYRQSYGYNRQTCFTGLKAIIEWSQLSKNVVRRVLDSLEQKQHIKRIGRLNEKDIKGTSYKIYLPCEIPGLTSHTVITLFEENQHTST